VSRFREDPSARTPSRFATGPNAHVTDDDVHALQESAGHGPARLNLHTGPDDNLHAMMILQPAGNYAQPRLHRRRSKVFHIVRGELLVLTFDAAGELADIHELRDGGTIALLVTAGTFHTNVALTPQAVYHEVIAGPFDPSGDERLFADFAPDQSAQAEGLSWLAGAVAARDPELARRMG